MFTVDPHLITTLQSYVPADSDGDPREVWGVTEMNGEIFVVYSKYNTIEVFEGSAPFNRKTPITITDMNEPCNIISYDKTTQLFISNFTTRVIWRVNINTQHKPVIDKFITLDTKPRMISLAADNNILIPTIDNRLLIHDIQTGSMIKDIQLYLPVNVYAWHAIESNNKTFYVRCLNTADKYTYTRDNKTYKCYYTHVREIDNSRGRVLRELKDKRFDCVCMALNSVGRVMIADWKYNRVVLLDEQLKYKRTLLLKKQLDNEHPIRLNYNKNSNRLAVGLYNGQVKMYEC
jgi:hypothetical protein